MSGLGNELATSACVLLRTIVALSETVGAQGTERPPSDAESTPKPEQDPAVYRVQFGVGTASIVTETPSSDEYDHIDLDGLCWQLGFDLAGQIYPNLLAQLRFAFAVMSEPDISADGDAGFEAKDLSLLMGAVGLGATYYLMPLNVFATAAAGVTQFDMRTGRGDDIELAHTDLGLWLNADLGWEARLDDDWNLGLAARGVFTTMGGGDGSQVYGTSLGLVASLTWMDR